MILSVIGGLRRSDGKADETYFTPDDSDHYRAMNRQRREGNGMVATAKRSLDLWETNNRESFSQRYTYTPCRNSFNGLFDTR